MSCRLGKPTDRWKNEDSCCTNSWLSRRDLHSYLLGDHEDEDNQINNNLAGRHNNNNNRFPGLGDGLHAAHQALLQQGGPVGFRPYHRPLHFPLKVCDMLFLKQVDDRSLQSHTSLCSLAPPTSSPRLRTELCQVQTHHHHFGQ